MVQWDHMEFYNMMRELAVLWVLIVVGCGIFNPGDKYNPDYVAKPIIEESCCNEDTIKADTIKVIIIE